MIQNIPYRILITGEHGNDSSIKKCRVIVKMFPDLIAVTLFGNKQRQTHQITANISDPQCDIVSITDLFHPDFIVPFDPLPEIIVLVQPSGLFPGWLPAHPFRTWSKS